MYLMLKFFTVDHIRVTVKKVDYTRVYLRATQAWSSLVEGDEQLDRPKRHGWNVQDYFWV